MKNFRTTHLLQLFSILSLAGCVSVDLPNSKPVHAQKVEYQEPASPFSAIKTESADHAWQSSRTDNTIFYISDCNPNSDPELKALADDTLSAMNEVKILESKDTEIYNDRAALEILAKGRIDGVEAKLWVLVFKKNGCNFTLSLTGSQKTFDSERAAFEAFKRSFKVGTW